MKSSHTPDGSINCFFHCFQDTFLISLDSHQLEIDTSDVALGTLSKAFK